MGISSIAVIGDLTVQWHCESESFGSTPGPQLADSQKKWRTVGWLAGAGLFTRQIEILDNSSLELTLHTTARGQIGKQKPRDILLLQGERALAARTSRLTQINHPDRPGKKWVTEENLGWSEPGAKYKAWIHNRTRALLRQITEPLNAILICDHGWGFVDPFFTENGRLGMHGRSKTLRAILADRLAHNSINSSDEEKPWLIIKSRMYPPHRHTVEGAEILSGRERENALLAYKAALDNKLVVVLNITDLRSVGINISEAISWERTLQDLFEAALRNFEKAASIPGIQDAQYVVVAFDADAIALIERRKPITIPPTLVDKRLEQDEADEQTRVAQDQKLEDQETKITLAFHPGSIEGDFYKRHKKPYANSAWVASMITYMLANARGEIDWKHCLSTALYWLRRNAEEGILFSKLPNPDSFDESVCLGFEIGQAVSWPSEVRIQKQALAEVVPESSHRGLEEGEVSMGIGMLLLSRTSELGFSANFTTFFQAHDLRCQTINLNNLALTQRKEKYEASIRKDPSSGRGLDHYSRTWWTLQALLLRDERRPEELFGRYLSYAYDVLRYGGSGDNEFFPDTVLCPYAKFDDFVTSDRSEIEGLRNMEAVITEYLNSPQCNKRPLNLAVFGPPGAGKSFGIKALLKSLKQYEFSIHTFNLSQFVSAESLVPCFHALQDDVLKGKIPVAFWDEFDATLNGIQFGWLQSFLAPMQDGHFVHGNRENPLIKCLFIFAGGRFARFGDLPDPNKPVERPREEVITMSKPEAEEYGRRKESFASTFDLDRMERRNLLRRQEHWRVAKGNDFRSRLKGTLDIREPNLERVLVGADYLTYLNEHPLSCDQLSFLVRRARLVRSILLKAHPQLFTLRAEYGTRGEFIGGVDGPMNRCDSDGIPLSRRWYKELNISKDVAMGFLSPYRFKHGARSIEAVIEMSSLSGRSRFDLGALAPEHVVSMHVDPRAFELASCIGRQRRMEPIAASSEQLSKWQELFLHEAKPPTEIPFRIVEPEVQPLDSNGVQLAALKWEASVRDESWFNDRVADVAHAGEARVKERGRSDAYDGAEILAWDTSKQSDQLDDPWESITLARCSSSPCVLLPSLSQLLVLRLGYAVSKDLTAARAAFGKGSEDVTLKLGIRLYRGGEVTEVFPISDTVTYSVEFLAEDSDSDLRELAAVKFKGLNGRFGLD